MMDSSPQAADAAGETLTAGGFDRKVLKLESAQIG
jgi:hypothetical protein